MTLRCSMGVVVRSVRPCLIWCALAASLAWTATAAAQAPTLKIIHMEEGTDQAAYDDWAEVLANAANTTIDGDGTTAELCGPINPAPQDLDCALAPIGQTGRDLLRFSWTYDWNGDPSSSFVALYVERFEAVSSNLSFYFIADTDGAAETVGGIPYLDPNDKVIEVKYHGGNGVVLGSQGPQICDYLPSNPSCVDGDPAPDANCDPIANPATGVVDGYNVAGSISSTCVALPQYCKYLGTACWDVDGDATCDASEDINPPAGCDTGDCLECNTGDRDSASLFDGKRFEVRAPWSTFGATTESGPLSLFWHVVVKNPGGSELAGLDNVGGAGDTLGKFGYETVDIAPTFQAGGASSPGSVYYGHVLTSTGTTPALANLSVFSSLGLPVQLWRDTTLDGELTRSTLELMATDSDGDGVFETIELGYDNDADSRPDPGEALAPGATYEIAIALDVAAGLDQLVDDTTITVEALDSVLSARDQTSIGFVAFNPFAPVASGGPGVEVLVPMTVTNFGGVTDVVNIDSVDISGDDGPYVTALYADADCDQVPEMPLTDSPLDADTDPDVGQLADLASACLVVGVTLPGSGSPGDVDRLRISGSLAAAPDKIGYSRVTIEVRDLIEVVPAAYGSDASPVPLSSADVRYFPLTIIHSGVVADAFELCVDWSPGTAQPYKVRLFSDPNNDGDIADGAELLVFDAVDEACGGGSEQVVTVGPLAAFGGRLGVVMEIQVPLSPPALSDPLHHIMRVDDRSGGSNDLDRGEVVSDLGKLGLFSDAGYSVAEKYYAVCDTVYFRARDLESVSQSLYYRVEITDPGSTTVCMPNPSDCSQHYITDLFGVFQDSYVVPYGATPGSWTVALIDDNTPSDESEAEEAMVEKSGVLSAPVPASSDYVQTAANDVSFTLTVTNNNVGADFAGTSVRYALLDDTLPAPNVWRGGVWTPFVDLTTTATGSVAVLTLGPAGGSVMVNVDIPNVAFPDENPPATYSIRATWVLACSDPISGPQSTDITVWGCASDRDGDGCGNCIDDAWRTPGTDLDGDGFAVDCDCDDTPGSGASIYPGATETTADGIDQDCDGEDQCYQDLDGDDFGTTTLVDDTDGDLSCATGTNVAGQSGDCDDTPVSGASIYPGASETPADGIDQDCDLEDLCYEDLDDDGVGTATLLNDVDGDLDCNTGDGVASVSGDCADADPATYSGAPEACDGNDNDCDSVVPAVELDGDSDAWVACGGWDDTQNDNPAVQGGGDCNDSDQDVHPGRVEVICNGIDDDCNFATPDDTNSADADHDGFTVVCGNDCDDTNFFIHPLATENCADGVDNNCNLLVDGADDDCVDLCTNTDADGDGFPDAACTGGTDCDDSNRFANPGTVEMCSDGIDNDCDGLLDAADTSDCPGACSDADNDGYPDMTCGGSDCNDLRPDLNPGAAENCVDGVDNDCDGLIDGSDSFHCPAGCDDLDSDGYADAACGGTDCNDTRAAARPGAGEDCSNGFDDDCDGLIDAADPLCPDGCADADGDGQLDAACGGADCDDTDAMIRSNTVEECTDSVDNDCDGLIDELDLTDCPAGCGDADGDGYDDIACGGPDCDDSRSSVSPGSLESACNGLDDDCDPFTADDPNPSDADGDGFTVGCGNDCGDDNPFIHEGAPERCEDTLDNDCDGLIDEAQAGVCPGDCADADGDGYYDSACGGRDCDDANYAANPGAGEHCADGIDNDCSGETDSEDSACATGCPDADADGHADAACGGSDCNDDDPTVHPGAGEHCFDALDNDCNGLVDAADVGGCPAGCGDADGDGYADVACSGTDCDDSFAGTNPGADEQCDGADNDCNGRMDEGSEDTDADGLADCVDTDANGNGWHDEVMLTGGGCTCDGSGGPGAGLWLLLVLLVPVRLRRQRQVRS